MPHDSPSMYEAIPGRSGQPSTIHRGRVASFVEGTYSLRGLYDAIAEGFRTSGLKNQLLELEARQADLKRLIEAASPPAPRLHPALAEAYTLQSAIYRRHSGIPRRAMRLRKSCGGSSRELSCGATPKSHRGVDRGHRAATHPSRRKVRQRWLRGLATILICSSVNFSQRACRL
jgi:hypothetical protein